jgi:hypothetical protein
MIFRDYEGDTRKLYERARELSVDLPSVSRIEEHLRSVAFPEPMVPRVAGIIADVLSPPFELGTYNISGDLSGVRGMTMRRELREYIETVGNAPDPENVVRQIAGLIKRYVPDHQNTDCFLEARVPLREHFGDVRPLLDEIVAFFLEEQVWAKDTQHQIVLNLCDVSRIRLDDVGKRDHRWVFPSKYRGEDCAEAYLGGTPLLSLLSVEVPVCIPQALRTEHTWMVGSTGTGKTTALKRLIERDVQRVQRGEASLIVMDSQRELIEDIRSASVFAGGEQLVHIDAKDVEYPVQLNIFSLGKQRLESHDPLQREQLFNTAIELYTYILDSLLGSELTAKQGTLFRYVIRLMMTVPGATIHTFAELFGPEGMEKFAPYIAELPKTQRLFFEREFWGREFASTRSQVLRRIWTVLENETLARMFAHPESKLDLFAEMNKPNVILIDLDKALLRDTGVQVLGRFFIALIAMAVQERAALSRGQKLPCYIYIDEAGDYFSNADAHLTNLLEQSRKQRVGLTLAHQRLSQFPNAIIDSLSANTAVKLANTDNPKDASTLARDLRTTPDFLMSQPTFSFATYARGVGTVSVSLPLGAFDGPTMTREQEQQVREKMRERYAVHYSAVEDPATVASPEPGPGTGATATADAGGEDWRS